MKNIYYSALGILYASITGILFGMEYLAISWVFHHKEDDFSVLAVTTINFFGAFLLAMLTFGWSKNFWKRVITTLKNHPVVLSIIGIAIAIGIFLLFFAVTQSSGGSTSLLERIQLLFIIALGVIFLGERLKKIQILGISISLLGFIGISAFPTDLTTPAIATIITAAFLYSLQSFLVKKYVPKIDGLIFSFLRIGISSTLLLMAFIAIEQFSTPLPSLSHSIILILVGFFATFIGQYFYFQAHNFLPISFLNVFILLEAVVVVLGEMLFFDFVPFSWTKILAGSVILLGLGILVGSRKE